jgi:hypothetical protein
MPEDRVTLWKVQALVAGFALVFAIVYWLLGPVGGSFMLIAMLPAFSVAAWLFLDERRANLLDTWLAFLFFLFVLLCLGDGLTRAVLGFGLPLGNKGLLALGILYSFAGLSVGQSLAKRIRKWGS